MHADAQFLSSILTARAESAGGSTLGVRVTWRTTIPPECVTAVRVNFRTTPNGRLAATNSTTNASQTEIIQTGLQCGTNYYIKVLVSGKPIYQGVSIDQFLSSNQVRVFIGGNEIVCMRFQSQKPECGCFITHACSNSDGLSHCRQHKYQSVVGVVMSECA